MSRVREGFTWGQIETTFRYVMVSSDHVFSERTERLTLGLDVQTTVEVLHAVPTASAGAEIRRERGVVRVAGEVRRR